MSRQGYVTATRLSQTDAQLDAEDRRILDLVAIVRLANARQLETLVGADDLAAVRRLRRRLRRLSDLDVLARLDRQIGGRRSGSAGYIYALGLVGQRLVARNGSGRIRTPWTPRASWLDHALQTSEVFVQLTAAERAGRLELRTFQSEPACWRTYSSRYGPATLKPDAFAHTATSTYEQFHFIEVDRGTESPATLARKLDQYLAYYQSGHEQTQRGLLPLVLWLVPDERRRVVLLDVLMRWPAEAPAMHDVRCFGALLGAFVEEPP